MPRRLTPLLLAAAATLALAAPATAARDTVGISGKAYAFNHMDTPIAGATIRVREFPRLSATTDANGDYELAVPDERNVTPYIEPPGGYNQIDLQTLHPRGEEIENANFQTPGDLEYNALAALLSVPFGPDGRPEECVIVTTASARNVRGVPYETFHERTPHGVPGATAEEFPPLEGPTYFNESVIPDPTKTETSEDGGIIWTGVPAGTHRIAVSSPTTRFASFLATCERGRVVNANPPWGAYELREKEKPLGASVVAGSLRKVRSSAGRLNVRIDAAEKLRARFMLRRRGKRISRRVSGLVTPGGSAGVLRLGDDVKPGPATLELTLRDAAGDVVTQSRSLQLRAR